MNIALWVVQVLLAGLFLMAGFMKATGDLDMLAEQMVWIAAVPELVPRIAGVAEIFGAIGLILPSALRIRPNLTPIAAVCLVLVMVLALPMHLYAGEPIMALVPPLVLSGLCGFVAWGRFTAVPIAPRAA